MRQADEHLLLAEYVADLTLLPDAKYHAMWAQGFSSDVKQSAKADQITTADAADITRIWL